MVRYIANIFLFRLLLPIIITLCILFRPTLFSSIYLIFMLLIPFVSLPSTDSMKGTTGIFIKVLLGVSTSLTLIQAAFQIALVIVKPYGQFLDENPKLEEILFYIGLAKLNGLTGTYILIWIGPEIGMFLTSLVLLFALKKLNPIEEVILESQAGVVDVTIRVPQSTDYAQYLIAVGRYATLILLCLAGVVRPSIEGGVYYSIFLGVATWWACYKQLKRGFAILLRCIIPLVILHMSALYAVNFKIIQKYLPEDGGCARYFDLAPFVTTIDSSTVGNATNSSTNSTLIMDERSFYYYFNRDITFYIYPVILYLLFYLLVLESKELMKPELLRGPTRRSKRVPGRLIQDSTGSVTVTNENEDIPLDVFAADCVSEEEEEEYDLTLFHHIIFALETIIQYVVRSSYIATNIIMMAWSITYLSWITFVLLLWANIIWLIPNQRKRMLSSSPFLVVYALFLLISAYVYSMRLNEDELPSKAEGVDLGEIGFKKPEGLPCIPLLVKSLYTVMFWITLRQYMHEKMEEKQTSALADMVAPLQVTVGTATGVKKESETDGSKFMTKFGQLINKFLIKFWIWVVAITLFAVAITGERMTVFRILYMTLFLFFILSFQFSFRVWRKVMFGFWLTVIVYSMIILVLVYTYQFKRFPDYWAWYLHIQKDQQHDIGLEQYKTKQLFVRLVTPTFFVIVTVIQLHYFHHDFMQLTDPKRTSTPQAETQPQENESINDSSVQGGAYMDRSRESTSKYYSEQDLAIVPAVLMTKWFEKALQLFFYTKHIIFLFLEIHMLKIVLFFTMLMCIYDKCAIYFVIVVLATISFTCGRNVQMFTAYFTSVFVSVLILGRMIYQISYINDKKWNVSCRVKKNPNLNETIVNNGPWLGFGKLSEIDQNLPGLVLWNIMFIVVMCLWKVIEVRQFNYRLSRGRSTEKRFFMFPRITRDDADKDLVHFAKYMANYGFYKFGVEISFIFIATLIAVRMDLYALMHCIWLLIMFSLPRNTLSRIWVVYLIFIAISIPFQYFQAVGLPPSLCIEFPWDAADPVLRSLQSWAFLLDNYTPPPVEKLVFDFMLLMAVSRQWVVFRIERRYAGQNYAGGSNESIISQAEQKDFVNPVPDYITFVRSYLDILKKAVLQSFLWITLAVVFWAGTSRVNVFSLGYLLCAFVFLWHGSDFYLRPIPKILRYWQFLLGYNVMVIFIKCSLQILGCIYPHYIPSVCCWLIQMFAITCVRNFVGTASRALPPTSSDDGQDCAISEGGISWDVICFTLLILQKRIFNSYNFFHIIDDTKATAILASRGAELMEEMRQQTMKEQEETEKKVLEKIREKMERIKANQQKIQAIRSGDYYMFDEVEDDEIDILPEEKESFDEFDVGLKPYLGEIAENEPKSVRIQDEPLPSTSQERDDDISSLTEPQVTIGQKIFQIFYLLWAFIDGIMVTLTKFLNKYSRNYRIILKVLAKEKRVLKERTNYNIGVRMGKDQIWQPAGSYHSLLRNSRKSEEDAQMSPYVDYGDEMSSVDQPTIVRLLLASWYLIMSRSEIVCYFVIFLNQLRNSNLISLPLPLMVFFWGSLTIPRPSKTFWVTIIAYTEVVVLLKVVFQFHVMPGNRMRQQTEFLTSASERNPFYPPTLIGLHKNKDIEAFWDLLLLLVVFFHRVLLKSMGIWSSTTPVTAALIDDGEYKVMGEKLIPVRHQDDDDDTDDSQPSTSTPKTHSSKKKSITDQDDADVVVIRTMKLKKLNNAVMAVRLGIYKYAEEFKLFIQQLLDPASRVTADVYSFMFLCDFINFFVILFGFSAFGTQEDGSVSDYLQDNRVPPLFLFMLIFQFMLIIIDRGIYLRKNILAKIIFQFVQIILLHIWLFILFPVVTKTSCNTLIPPQIYYIAKCSYLLLSAYQIRCGYPTRILGNFLCKGYGYVNMFLFKGFMLIPFLFELRTCMDWMWTETSMAIFDWIKLEDIFQHIFLLKCSRNVEDEYPQPRAQEKNRTVKYLMGGALLTVIIGIIWFPLVFFSLGDAVGNPNPPSDVSLEIRIGPYEPIYQMTVQSNSIFQFTPQELEDIKALYNAYQVSENFIFNYEAADITAIRLNTDSSNIWSISPPDRKRMIKEVNSTKLLKIRLEYKITHRTSKAEDSGLVTFSKEITMEPSTNTSINEDRENLLKYLDGKEAEPVRFTYILPKFVKVTNRGTVDPISVLLLDKPDVEATTFRNVTIKLLRENTSGYEQAWWKVNEICNDYNYEHILMKVPYHDCKDSILLYAFNDKVFPPTLDIITSGGIIGLYTTLVLVASRILRGFFADGMSKIMFEDLPNVDRVLRLCLDIYLVREVHEFALEEDLFAKLVFLFRSPETLIKWSRPKEEVADEDDPEGDGE
ncbi:piezo-type mechanosensitive ion channel component isoform X27 [Diorhabda carinulata]|uniref:piezo-type mechanosensitive ion channel component isoform X27 n=1 Tax=Diorhabda carinulata TaxID=1163345 RepID=UPI0025A03967|nr:piezo-type mechanosensitive ion channel component isoform X27 [Diorhabda carinulata]